MLKNRISEYVRIAASGEVVLISDRGRVVAELVAPQSIRSDRVSDALLANAVREGLVTPRILPGGAPLKAKPVSTLKKILAELVEDRNER